MKIIIVIIISIRVIRAARAFVHVGELCHGFRLTFGHDVDAYVEERHGDERNPEGKRGRDDCVGHVHFYYTF